MHIWFVPLEAYTVIYTVCRRRIQQNLMWMDFTTIECDLAESLTIKFTGGKLMCFEDFFSICMSMRQSIFSFPIFSAVTVAQWHCTWLFDLLLFHPFSMKSEHQCSIHYDCRITNLTLTYVPPHLLSASIIRSDTRITSSFIKRSFDTGISVGCLEVYL